MLHRVAAATIVAVALLGLTACTGSPTGTSTAGSFGGTEQPGDEGQSKADACALIRQSIDDAIEEFENSSTADPASVVDTMKSAAEKLADTATRITNDEVAALIPSLQSMFAEVAEVMDAVVRGDVSKVDDLAQLGTEFRETSTAFQQVCGP